MTVFILFFFITILMIFPTFHKKALTLFLQVMPTEVSGVSPGLSTVFTRPTRDCFPSMRADFTAKTARIWR